MIDWSKPLRRTDNKIPVAVIKINGDGTAWVELSAGLACLMDREGKKRGVVSVENIPEPKLAYLRVYCDGGVMASNRTYDFDGWVTGESGRVGPTIDYLLDLTDPDAPKIERVTK